MTITVPWNASWTGDLDPCPECHGEGFTTAPYMMGLKTGDLYTITICACEVGRAKAVKLAAMTTKIPEDE